MRARPFLNTNLSVRGSPYFWVCLRAATLYASLEGNDGTGDGTVAKPFLSISKAIQSATNADNIVLTCTGSHCEFPVSNAGLEVTKSLNIKADTAKTVVLDAKLANRILSVRGDPTVNIENVRLTRGKATSGAALAVFNNATVTLKSCTVRMLFPVALSTAWVVAWLAYHTFHQCFVSPL